MHLAALFALRPPSAAAMEAPFLARVTAESAYIRASPEEGAPEVGLVHRGDELEVTSCRPDCQRPGAWALLGGDGAIRLALLQPSSTDDPTLPPANAVYRYGAVRGKGTRVYLKPDEHSRRRRWIRGGDQLAFLVDDDLLLRGWLARPGGGFVRVGAVRFAKPSPFVGEQDPKLPLAFTVRGLDTPGGRLPRQSRGTVLGRQGSDLVTTLGKLPRSAVRLAFQRPRPEIVPPGARWVHVDLRQQVLVAYAGDRPVLATLLSSGKKTTPTPRGRFQVWVKTIHEPMHGERHDPYLVDEVPFALFFRKGLSLHGTFWHDQFGTPVSHGCVNLSFADAAWLFDWAPPRLPNGWHSAIPLGARRPSLWVIIERAPAGAIPRLPSPAPSSR